jgi:hypothetical protein
MIGQIYFYQFVNYTIAAMAIGVVVSLLAAALRKRVLRTKRLNGRLVVNELGALIGKVGALDIRRGRILINTSFGNSISYNVDRIVEVSDKVVVK